MLTGQLLNRADIYPPRYTYPYPCPAPGMRGDASTMSFSLAQAVVLVSPPGKRPTCSRPPAVPPQIYPRFNPVAAHNSETPAPAFVTRQHGKSRMSFMFQSCFLFRFLLHDLLHNFLLLDEESPHDSVPHAARTPRPAVRTAHLRTVSECQPATSRLPAQCAAQSFNGHGTGNPIERENFGEVSGKRTVFCRLEIDMNFSGANRGRPMSAFLQSPHFGAERFLLW